MSSSASLPTPPPFSPPPGFLWVNGLWFASLLCSLGTAVTIILVKQWLQFYSLKLWSGSDYEYTKKRQQRYNSLKQWHVPTIISTLPLLLHISLLLFALGLAVMLHQINSIIANIVTGLVACLLILNGVSLVLPLLYKDCPYKSSASIVMETILVFIIVQVRAVKNWSMSTANYAIHYYQQQNTLPLSYNQSSPISPGVNSFQARPQSSFHHGVVGSALLEDSAKLSEDSILWLAQASQSKDRVKSSLEHIRYLEHSPSLINNLFSHNIISELTKAIYVPLPPREQFFGKYSAFNGDHILRNTSIVGDTLPCMLSLLWVWEHPAYFSDFPPPAISSEYMPSTATHSWLLGDWVLIWRLLQQECNSNLMALESQGWNLEVFAAIICTEVLFYQKHVKRQKLPLLARTLKSLNMEDPDPFYDLYKMIEEFHVQNLYTHSEIMRWVFSALKQVLFSLDKSLERNTEFTQSILLLLLNFWEKHMMHPAALCELMCCVNLLVSHVEDDKRKFLSITSKSEDLTLVSETFRKVIDSQMALTLGDEIVKEGIIAIASWGIFKVMCQQPQSTEADRILIGLPARFSQSTINKIIALADYQWDSISQMERHADFIILWITKSDLPKEAKWSLFFCLQDLLTSSVLQNQPAAIPVIKRIIVFLLDNMLSDHWETSIYVLHNILEHAIGTQNIDLVKQFLQVNAASQVAELLATEKISAVMHKIWKALIRRLKLILKNRKNNLGKDNHKLFRQLLTEIIDVGHVPGQGVNLLDTTAPKPIENPPSAVASSPDGRMGAEGREDGIIHIYDLAAGKYLSGIPFQKHIKNVEHIAFSFNGKYIASASDDSTICVWDIEKSTLIQKFMAHANGVIAVMFSPSDQLLLIVLDASVHICNLQRGLQTPIITGHTGGIVDVNFSPDESKIVTGSYDCSIAVWDANTGAAVTGKMPGHSEFISTAAFIDNDSLLSSAWDNEVCIWNISRRARTARWINNINHLERAPNISLALQTVSSDGLITASAWQNYVICTWKLSGSGSRKKRNYEGCLQPVTAVAFSPDNRFITCGAEDGTVHVWSVELESKAVNTIKTHFRVVSLAYSQDGTYIASGLSNGTIRFWDIATGKLTAGKTDIVIGPNNSALALSMDGQYIATGSIDGALNLWNTSTGDLFWGPQHIHKALISYITFSTDGHYILTAAYDNSVCVWNAHNGMHLKQMKNVSSKTILQHRFQSHE